MLRPPSGQAPPTVRADAGSSTIARDGHDVGGAPAAAGAGRFPGWMVHVPTAALERLESEPACWAVLGTAIVASVALTLWLTRGTTFNADDFLYFVASRGLDLKVLLAPHNGHLIFVPRLIYAVGLKLFGASHYIVFRLVQAFGIALVAGLFFVLAKRRIGPTAALAPSVLLLFLGSGWQSSLDPAGSTHVICVAAGLGALLALDRPSVRADLTACALLVVSVASFSLGLMFVIGAAVSVLLAPDRSRRAWVFLVPLVLYGAWFVAPKLDKPPFTTATGVSLGNVLLIPNGVAVAASAVASSVTGLSYNFTNPTSYTVDSPWGYLVAAVAAAALILRLRRGNVPISLWTSLAMMLSYWAAISLATHLTAEPNQNRYIYDGAVLALIVGADALRGIPLSRGALLAVFGATLLALCTNIAMLRVGGGFLRGFIPSDRAELAALEIARDHVDPRFVPQGEPQLTFLDGIAGGAGPYLAAVDRNGSPAFTLAELRSQPEPVRALADSTLASALQLHLAPAQGPPAGTKCLRLGSRVGRAELDLRPPGVLIRSSASQTIALRRFAAFPTAQVGRLSSGHFASLQIPADRAPDPWQLLAPGGPLTVCEPGSR